ncbi:MFS transporter [Ureibacillus acetophenoni]|uniref:Sugar phosphate permease n=1 Tax=Ureibacillus acetophenoni TaxID=614649 RepID=A0A285UMQ2_9BACL|nr:MFS transporter [Ureibacillus acetophenoni]SOC43119.1 sugar phosphate permease [Ureibacillus acetophenoni]
MNKQNNRYRWVVFTLVLFIYLLMSSQRTAPGLITEQMMLDFNITATTIGLLTSIQFFVYTGLQIPMGMMADRFGPNFFLIIGSILTGVGTIIYSVSTSEVVLFFARVLAGTGDATIWVNMILILSHWFTAKEFTRLIGIAAMTGSLGYLLASVPYALLIDYLGWRTSFFISGTVLCLCGILLYFVLLNGPKKERVRQQNDVPHEKTWALLKRIFTKRQAWALFFCHFGIVGTYVGFISSWGVPYAMNMYGMSRTAASQLIMLGLIGALIGAPLAGWIASRLGMIKRPYIFVHVTLLCMWSTFLIFSGSPPLFLLLILFFMIGLSYGANALTFAAVRQTFPVKESGLVSGFANTGGFLSAILLPSIFGKILDQFQVNTGSVIEGYSYGFIIPVIFSFIGLLGVMALKEKSQLEKDVK